MSVCVRVREIDFELLCVFKWDRDKVTLCVRERGGIIFYGCEMETGLMCVR